jgi:hypothetical protein
MAYERATLIESRKQIPIHLAGRAERFDEIEILDIIGTGLTRPAWQRVFRLMTAGSRLRVLLLDPAGEVIGSDGLPALWADSPDPPATKIRQAAAGVVAACRRLAIDVEVRHYDEPPVSRYVHAGSVVYQTRYPRPGEDSPVPVAALAADGVLGRRARREFAALWQTRSTPADHPPDGPPAGTGDPPPADLPPADPPPVSTGGGHLSLRLVAHRKAVPADLVTALDRPLREVDVIDVAGAAQVSDQWSELVRRRGEGRVRMRVLLLDPDGDAATLRARESTRWRGDDLGLRAKIRRNIARLQVAADSLGADVEVRVYDQLPVSRYVRANEIIYQSVYPADESARDVPLAVLPAGSPLAERGAREFEVMWERARPVPPNG